MNKLIRFGALSLTLFVLILSGCASDPAAPQYDGYTITGDLRNVNEGTRVLLQTVEGRKVTPIDTAIVDAEGKFEMKGKIDDKGFAQLMIGRNRVFTTLDNYPIHVVFDQTAPRDYLLSGAEEVDGLQALTSRLSKGVLDKDFVKTYTDTVGSPYLAYVAMQYLKTDEHMDVYEKVSKRFKTEVPDSKITTQLDQFVSQTKKQAEAAKASNQLTRIGAEAPDLSYPNPDGKEMALSDLRGKVVLLDFWASWCGPCRRENPNVVRLYDKYKSKGFDVYSVSLDSKTDRWVQAIEKDNLKWDSHVSDLKKWRSVPAATYGVRLIPTTFLIDAEGKIIGKNLRGAALEAKLKEIFG